MFYIKKIGYIYYILRVIYYFKRIYLENKANK